MISNIERNLIIEKYKREGFTDSQISQHLKYLNQELKTNEEFNKFKGVILVKC